MNAETFLEQFAHLAEAPNSIPKLRELILQLAVRGKLVPQDQNDEPARDLLERISAEKKRLVTQGAIRKAQRTAPSLELEAPYALPSAWVWVRLADVGSIMGGGTPRSSDLANFAEHGTAWLTPADMRGLTGKYVSRGKRDLSELGLASSSATLMPAGSVLFSSRAPIGYVAIAENEISTNQGFKSVVPHINEMSEYIYCFLLSAANEIDRKATGTTFREISGKGMSLILMPLPPLDEQKRIVAKVDELMALCDELEAKQQAKRTKQIAFNRASLNALTEANGTSLVAAWNRVRDHFDHLYTVPETVAELRQTILQLAVMGRLVPQDPTDEPASELLKKIQAEKQRLITEGVLRTGKPLPAFKAEEAEHEIPVSWSWARLDDLIVYGPQNGYSPKAVDFETPVRTLILSAVTRGEFDETCFKYVDLEPAEIERYWLEDGDLLVQRSNTPDYVGVSAVYRGLPRQFMFPDLIMRVRLSFAASLDYVHKAMLSPAARHFLRKRASGTSNSMVKINQASLRLTPIPIPPFAEQRRIVAKVDQLMTLCDALEARLQQSQTDADNLLTAIVHELVGSQGGEEA